MVVTNPSRSGDVLVAVALGIGTWILTSQRYATGGKGSLAPTPEGINNVVLL